MKNIIKFLGLLSLICFSFFYTDKVMNVALEQDKIMISINDTKDDYKIDAMDAIIDNDTIIPGIYGKEVDVEKSYNNMKSIGLFHENYFVFKDIKPNISLEDNLDKYIISANGSRQSVSLLFIIDDNDDLSNLYDIVKLKNVKVNLFFDYDFLNKKVSDLSKIKNVRIYSYGEGGRYTKDNIMYADNLIERVTKENANYCLVVKKDINNLSVCSANKSYTIYPSINIANNALTTIKDKLTKGSLILVDINDGNMKQLPAMIDYIVAKGIKIEYLDELLSEKYS